MPACSSFEELEYLLMVKTTLESNLSESSSHSNQSPTPISILCKLSCSLLRPTYMNSILSLLVVIHNLALIPMIVPKVDSKIEGKEN